MIRKEISYTDFNGEQQVDVYHFHLSKTELLEVEAGFPGGFESAIQKIVETQDKAALIEQFKRILESSVGEKSEDGKRFVKNDQIRLDFKQSAAYDALFMELATDDVAAATFINGVIPAGLSEDQDKPLAPPPAPKPPEVQV